MLGLLGAGLAALPCGRSGAPPPTVHDEFANLLIAQTLRAGRLANPPHPLAQSFETFHVLQHPAYVGKYLPGAGLQLALGPLLGAPSIVGVWLTVGALAVALCWMLEAAAPRTLAAPCALLLTIYYAAATYWGGSYWGGALFALGGAWALGGAARLARWPGRPLGAAIGAGAGVAIILLTRPYEGAWFCLGPGLLALGLLVRRARQRPCARRGVWRALAGFAAPVAATAAFLVAYNHATTGSALTFAHRLYEREVMPDRGLFVWDQPHPPSAPRHFILEHNFRDAVLGLFTRQHITAAEVFSKIAHTDAPAAREFFLPAWLWPWVALGMIVALGRRGRVPLVALAALAGWLGPALTLRFFAYPHYAAAWAAAIALLAVIGWRQAWHWARRHRAPRGALALWAVAAGAWIAADYGAFARADGSVDDRYLPDASTRAFWRQRPMAALLHDRELVDAALRRRAAATGRSQLVLVEFPARYQVEADWVYNGPAPDAQQVTFARSWDSATDARLAEYYPTRDRWRARLGADGRLAALEPWPAPDAAAAEPIAFGRAVLDECQRQPVRDPQTALLMASAAQGAGDLERAEKLYRRALELEPGQFDALYNLGVVLIARGRLPEARAQFERVLQAHPGHASAHNNLGTLLYNLGQLEAARAHYETAVALEPRNTAARANLGNAYLHLNRPADSAAQYAAALALDPANADVCKSLGDALALSGQLPQAIARYEEALRLRPNFPAASQNLAIVRAQAAQAPAR